MSTFEKCKRHRFTLVRGMIALGIAAIFSAAAVHRAHDVRLVARAARRPTALYRPSKEAKTAGGPGSIRIGIIPCSWCPPLSQIDARYVANDTSDAGIADVPVAFTTYADDGDDEGEGIPSIVAASDTVTPGMLFAYPKFSDDGAED